MNPAAKIMRSLGITVLSLTLTTIVIANAYYQKKQFYPSVVYITKSNPSMSVIYIQAFICVLIAGKIMRRVFFGELRSAEFEHLMERSWYAITETCLAFTVFRDDFNPKFVALFTLLLFLKSFHWLAEDRVDYMERSPVISVLFHLRVLSLLFLLGSLDFYFIQHAYLSTISKGASVQLVFGFEYAILFTVVMNIAIKYALHAVDITSETPWDNKAVFLLYTELVMGFIKVVLYIAFVAIMVRIYTLPLFAFRPMYYTIRNFKKAFSDVILSRRAIHNMNTLYPDATPEELQAADNVCIICREEMTTASKKLPCNHIFHTSCLRSWFQRQQTCPTCRLNILRTPTGTTAAANNNNMDPRAQQQDPRFNNNLRGAAQMPPLNPQNNPLFFNPFLAAAGGGGGAGVGAAQHLFQQQVNFHFQQQHQQQQGGAQGPPQNQPPSQTPTTPPQAGGPGTGGEPSSSSGAQNQHGSSAGAAGTALPQFVFPPFPFMPFMAPPPLPPQHLRNLSADELRRMEGNERQNVEARIQCLMNIQVMLDAAVVMMQQYSAAATMSIHMPPPSGGNGAAQQPSTSQNNNNHHNNNNNNNSNASARHESPASNNNSSTTTTTTTATVAENNDPASSASSTLSSSTSCNGSAPHTKSISDISNAAGVMSSPNASSSTSGASSSLAKSDEKTSPSAGDASSTSIGSPEDGAATASNSSSTISGSDQVSLSPEEEIRRRRLQKFAEQQTPRQQQQPSNNN